MSLGIKGGLNPYLKDRIQWIEDVIDYYGGQTVYISGYRSHKEQVRLWEKRNSPFNLDTRPVAQPGCSQHEYGYAVDVAFLPAIDMIPDLGLPTSNPFTEYADALAEYVGLVLVRGDPGHYQVIPGNEFKAWAKAAGLCPDPVVTRGRVFEACGPGFVGEFRDLTTQFCVDDFGRITQV